MRRFWIILFATLLVACATSANGGRSLPYEAWALRFVAPAYMEAWVETARVEDMAGRVFPNSGGGTVGISYAGSASGWPKGLGASPGVRIIGADLPARIYVRWQSLVEPQTYEVVVEIPDEVRQLMLTQATSVRHASRRSYRDRLVVGLAPGGPVKVWVSGTLGEPIEVMCVQATVVADGPYGGESEGKHRPLSSRARPYAENNPIPYDSWKCD